MTCSGPHDGSSANRGDERRARTRMEKIGSPQRPPTKQRPAPRATGDDALRTMAHRAVGVAMMAGSAWRCCASTLRQRRKGAAFSKQQAPRARERQPHCAHCGDGAEGEVRSSNRRRMLPSVLLSQPHPNPTRPTHLTSPDLRRLHPCRLRSVRRSPNQPTRRRQAGLSLLRVAHRAAQ